MKKGQMFDIGDLVRYPGSRAEYRINGISARPGDIFTISDYLPRGLGYTHLYGFEEDAQRERAAVWTNVHNHFVLY